MKVHRNLHTFSTVSLLAVLLTVELPAQDKAAQKENSPRDIAALTVKQVTRLGTRRYRHGSMIREVWFTPDGRIVSAGGQRIRAWDAETGELRGEVRHAVYSWAFFDGDSRVLIAEPLKNGVKTHTFRVVDLSSGEQLATWNSPNWVEQAAIGRGTDFAVLGNLNRTVSIVDLKTGEERDRIEYIGPKSNQAGRPNVTLSPDASQLAVEVRSDYVRFYSLAEDGKVGRLLATIDTASFHKVVFSSRPDEVALLGSRTSAIWNSRTGKQLVEWREPGPNRPSDAVFAANGREIALLADGVVRTRETSTGKELGQLPVQAEPRCDHIALSPGEDVLAAGGLQGRLRLFDVQSGQEIRFDAEAETVGPAESVAISDDGKWIASAEYKGVVSLWNGKENWRRVVLPDDDIRGQHVYDTSAGPGFLTFLPDKSRLLAGSGRYHNSLNLWDVTTAKRDSRYVGHGMPITGVATSRDGSVIVASGHASTRVWDASGRLLPVTFPRSNSVSISRDGKLLAMPVQRHLPQRGGGGIPEPQLPVPGVDVWDIQSGKLVQSMSDVTSENYGIYSVSFSRDGRLLAGMAKDGLYIWDVSTGQRTRLFPVPQPEHEPFWHAPVRGCAFSPTENIVALPTGTGSIYFVDAGAEVDGDWRLAIASGHDGAVKSVAWRRDGSHLVSGGEDSTVVLWKVEPRN